MKKERKKERKKEIKKREKESRPDLDAFFKSLPPTPSPCPYSFPLCVLQSCS